MAALLLLFLVFVEYVYGWEYNQIWCDIPICGTNDKKYPFCCDFDESPIDIQSALQDEEICDDKLEWDYDGSSKWRVIKKQHTVEVDAVKIKYRRHGQKLMVLNTGTNYIGSFQNPLDEYPAPECYEGSDTIDLVDEFCFAQMHFHWGLSDSTGSEHFDEGHQYALEAHFVHFNCAAGSVDKVSQKYATEEAIEEARCNGDDVHELAVIGVWFEITEHPNPTIERILDAVDEINQMEQEGLCEQEAPGEPGEEGCEPPGSGTTDDRFVQITSGLDLTDILTNDLLDGGYWTYEGSLTTPPCTTDVRWFFMKKRAHIGRDQIERFRKVTRPCSDELISPNYRPIQENPNPIFECEHESKHHQKKKSSSSSSFSSRSGSSS